MGKEISPAGKAMRTGLASLALAAPIFFSGCSQEPTTPPQAPVGVSGNSAQFPNIKDRPLTNQTLVPTPRPTERPTLIPTPAPRENLAEQGWRRYTSSIFSPHQYQIDYPPFLNPDSLTPDNLFVGERINNFSLNFMILNVPVKDWITLDDYKNEITKPLRQGSYLSQKTNIANQQAWRIEITGQLPTRDNTSIDLFSRDNKSIEVKSVTYIFLYKGEVWSLTYLVNSSALEKTRPQLEKMAQSFKLLR